MSTSIPSTNMNMPVPVVGVDPDPQWANDLNSCLSILDTHDHSPGYGVPVTPAGLNISSDLSFGGNNATTFRSVRFQPQTAVLALGTDLGCLYEVTNDLYYNDGVGNQIRITQAGSVTGSSGTITGLPSGTASASFSAGVFTFNASTNTGANTSVASILLRNNSAGSKVLTLSPPAAMGADYTLTLPPVPASTKFVSLDATGAFGASWGVDNSTIEISSNVVQVKAAGIGTTQLADASVTPAKKAALGQQVSASCGAYGFTSSSYNDVTNLTVTITSTGRPIWVGCISDGSGSFSRVFNLNSSNFVVARIMRDATEVADGEFSGGTAIVPPMALHHIDVVGAGTYVYKVQVKVNSTGTGAFNYAKLLAYEL